MSGLYERAIREELAYWPGVTVAFGKRSKHRQAVFRYRGQTRFVVYPDSPSDGQRGHLNCLADVRKELAALEARRLEVRPKKRKRAGKVVGSYHPRPPEWMRRIEIVPAKDDPWSVLRAVTFAPEPRKGHLREALRRLGGLVRRMVARSRRDAPKCAPTPGERESGD